MAVKGLLWFSAIFAFSMLGTYLLPIGGKGHFFVIIKTYILTVLVTFALVGGLFVYAFISLKRKKLLIQNGKTA